MTSSFLCSKMDSQPSATSPEDFSGDQSSKTSDGGLRCWDFKCKRKASWERGETKNRFSYSTSAPFPPPLLGLQLHISTFVDAEPAGRSSSGSSEVLCIADGLTAQLSQERGHPERGPRPEPALCETRQQKYQQIQTQAQRRCVAL